MDCLNNYFKLQKERFNNKPAMLGSIFTSWHAFDKYYKLVDETSAYTTALLLHPSLRKAYLTTAWKRE